ncbi:MAG TPA: hypothetical protein VK929_10070 [Longimicrobiales bacterium]|nr:hypothetical protein [Longimicrobiales bacterium]
MMAVVVLAQVDARAVEALERIALTQTVMATVLVLVGLVIVAGAVITLLQLRAARRMLQQTVTELKPQVAPLVDRAKGVTDDVAGVTDNVRRKVDDVLHTVEELRRSVERGGAATEERLRRFTAVLDIAQTEAEELLLDAAATAHGMQETARVLREQRGPRPDRGTRAGIYAEHEEDEDE